MITNQGGVKNGNRFICSIYYISGTTYYKSHILVIEDNKDDPQVANIGMAYIIGVLYVTLLMKVL